MGKGYRFDKLSLDGKEEYEIIRAFTSLTEEQIENIKDKEKDGKLTQKDVQSILDRQVAKTVEETVMEDIRDLETLMGNSAPQENTNAKFVRPVKLQANLFGNVKQEPSVITLTGRGAGSIFNQKVEETATDMIQENVTSNNEETRVERYNPEMVEKLLSVNTLKEYREFTEWYKWYLEEDKDNFTPRQRMSTFILVVLLEIQVFRNYGIDVSSLQNEITVEKYPIQTLEEYQPTVIQIVGHMNKKISAQLPNFNSQEVTLDEFIEERSICFSRMFEAVL